jgi:hypothetical protein
MMKSGDDQPESGASRERYSIAQGDVLDRIVLPLTVLHAHVQLLRRRIRQNGPDGIDDLDQVLARMEDATRTMTAELWAALGATSHHRGDTDRSGARTLKAPPGG